MTRRPANAGPWIAAALVAAISLACATGGRDDEERRPVPVEVAPVEQGELALRRTFYGTLEPSSSIVVSTMTGGRLASLPLDVGDPVRRDQVVATLDRGEYDEAVRQAVATLSMARARQAEASVQLELAEREHERMIELFDANAVSAAELDEAETLARQRAAATRVAEAEVARAEAALASARVRLDETAIVATWSGDDPERVVAERFVDEGTIVSSDTPLLSIVDVDPLRAVVFVTERDYARLAPGQPVEVRTETWPGETFPASVARVAPVFDAASRQARVELSVPNPDGRLVPGVFVQAEVVLEVRDDATIVPADALVTRDGRSAVFVVDPEGSTARLRPVEVGLRDGDRVEVVGEGIAGRVVVLGQQLLEDGSPIAIASEAPGAEPR